MSTSTAASYIRCWDSQAKVAEALHISRVTMSRIENDKADVTEDFLQELHRVLDGRSGPSGPEGGGVSFYTPVPNRFEFRVAEADYPCRHCRNNSVNAFDTGESPCGRCGYNRRKSNRLTSVGRI